MADASANAIYVSAIGVRSSQGLKGQGGRRTARTMKGVDSIGLI